MIGERRKRDKVMGMVEGSHYDLCRERDEEWKVAGVSGVCVGARGVSFHSQLRRSLAGGTLRIRLEKQHRPTTSIYARASRMGALLGVSRSWARVAVGLSFVLRGVFFVDEMVLRADDTVYIFVFV